MLYRVNKWSGLKYVKVYKNEDHIVFHCFDDNIDIAKISIKYKTLKNISKIKLDLETDGAKSFNKICLGLLDKIESEKKGGTIKRIREHLNPRGARVVALETLSRGFWN